MNVGWLPVQEPEAIQCDFSRFLRKRRGFAQSFNTFDIFGYNKAKCQAKCRDVGEYLGRLEGGRAGAAVGGPVVAAAPPSCRARPLFAGVLASERSAIG